MCVTADVSFVSLLHYRIYRNIILRKKKNIPYSFVGLDEKQFFSLHVTIRSCLYPHQNLIIFELFD